MKKCLLVSVFLFLFFGLSIQAQTLTHSIGENVADSLMKAWIVMWEIDDIEAVEAFYADDVVLHADTSSQGLIGKKDVLAVTIQRMREAGPLVIKPDHSYENGNTAYQTGRFMIDGGTGAYSFIFNRTVNNEWKLKYTYYLHDLQVK